MKSIILPLAAGFILLGAPAILAQGQSAARKLTLRGYLHDPVHPALVPFVFKEPDNKASDKSGGKETPLVWRMDGLSDPVEVNAVENTLYLHLPGGQMAARIKVAESIKRCIVIVVPATEPGTGLPYRMVLLDDDPARFPYGTSKVLNMTGVQAAVEAGEHKLKLDSGKISMIPEVRKVDDFNMAQANFYVRNGESWIPITERRLQFMDNFRRVYLIFSTPGSKRPPFVKTLLDCKQLEGMKGLNVQPAVTATQ